MHMVSVALGRPDTIGKYGSLNATWHGWRRCVVCRVCGCVVIRRCCLVHVRRSNSNTTSAFFVSLKLSVT